MRWRADSDAQSRAQISTRDPAHAQVDTEETEGKGKGTKRKREVQDAREMREERDARGETCTHNAKGERHGGAAVMTLGDPYVDSVSKHTTGVPDPRDFDPFCSDRMKPDVLGITSPCAAVACESCLSCSAS